MTISRCTVAGVLAVSSLLSLLPARATARESLQGRTLPAAAVGEDGESQSSSLLGHFLGGRDQLEGAIESVTVVRDDGHSVELRVRYTGFAGGKLWAYALDEKGRKQQQIQNEPIIVGRSEPPSEQLREVTLELEMDASWDWGSLSSAYVSVNVGLPHRSTPGVVKTYELGKSWGASE